MRTLLDTQAGTEIFQQIGFIPDVVDDGAMPTREAPAGYGMTEFLCAVMTSRIDAVVVDVAKDPAKRAAIAAHWLRVLTRGARSARPIHPLIMQGRFLEALVSQIAGRAFDPRRVPASLRQVLQAGPLAGAIYWALVSGMNGNAAFDVLEELYGYLHARDELEQAVEEARAEGQDPKLI